jgi:hypothetical protein
MKKITLLMITILSCIYSYGQGLEDFTNSNATASYESDSFLGNDGITWSYVASRNANNDANNSGINLPAIMLRRASDDSKITSSIIEGGIGDFSVKLYKGFTGGGNRQVEVFINGVSIGASEPFDNFDEQIFTVENVNVSGDFVLEIRNITSRQVIIDDIQWTGFTGTGSPSLSADESVSGLSYFEGNYDAVTAEGSFSVQGFNLTEDVTVQAPADFEVSLTSQSNFSSSLTLSPVDGSLESTEVFVRLQNGLVAGNYDANVSISGDGEQIDVAVSGSVDPADPQLAVSPNNISGLNYLFGEGPSQVGQFTVEGKFLESEVTITAPDNFEVSDSPDSGFSASVSILPIIDVIQPMETLTQTSSEITLTVYVRLAEGLTEGDYAGDVEIASTGATTQNVAVSGTVLTPATLNMIITGVFDGPLPGGVPKALELYVINDIADLSNFGIGVAFNGNGSNGEQFTFPEGPATAGTFIYIATEIPGFNEYFGFDPDYTFNAVSINGDDAIELFENSQVIDTFGDINTDGTGEDWEYTDGWAYRVSGTQPDGVDFNIANWTFSGTDANDDETSNATAETPWPLGTFASTLNVSTFEDTVFKLYPNPVTNGVLSIESSYKETINVEIYNMFGKQVLTSKTSKNINVNTLNSGLYLVKINQGSSSFTKKIVIK